MAHHPLPVIVIGSLTQRGFAASIEVLRIGAIAVIAKPGGPASLGQVTERLKQWIRALASGPSPNLRAMAVGDGGQARPHTKTNVGDAVRRTRSLIAIGGSTGGTNAIETLLTHLRADLPLVVVVQHMPPGFTTAFAKRLDGVCPMREAQGGERLEPGPAYIAPAISTCPLSHSVSACEPR